MPRIQNGAYGTTGIFEKPYISIKIAQSYLVNGDGCCCCIRNCCCCAGVAIIRPAGFRVCIGPAALLPLLLAFVDADGDTELGGGSFTSRSGGGGWCCRW